VDVVKEPYSESTICDYMDLNGDGLPDRVTKIKNSDLEVWFNTGTGFKDFGTIIATGDTQPLRFGSDFGKLTENDYMDLNGDGYPDRVEKVAGNDTLKTWENRIYGDPAQGESAGKLQKVLRPNGGYTLYRYQALKKDQNKDCRPNLWVVSEIENHDGFTKRLLLRRRKRTGIPWIRRSHGDTAHRRLYHQPL
jgi:hypothetical protein